MGSSVYSVHDDGCMFDNSHGDILSVIYVPTTKLAQTEGVALLQ